MSTMYSATVNGYTDDWEETTPRFSTTFISDVLAGQFRNKVEAITKGDVRWEMDIIAVAMDGVAKAVDEFAQEWAEFTGEES